jgi:hypothetical protein
MRPNLSYSPKKEIARDVTRRNCMKKWLLLVLVIVLMSGCSWRKAWEWIDKMEWERDDQTISIVNIFVR